jgi:predicted DNA-binding protein
VEPTSRLISIVFRLPKPNLQALKSLSSKTRVRQSEYLREAIEDLLTKYQAPVPRQAPGQLNG